ncbi:MAG TPA: redoxin domain-containing protein [Thiobacillaceae bacterium]|nr:redoxin domain-containing protein [Thiobacillaceae bacterium]HNU64028.1 redoxin domain-containing protein [Thiobacillaceae bacterium]
MRNLFNMVKFGLIAACCISMQVQAGNLSEDLLHKPIFLISGKKTSLAEFQGKKAVYLKFWATWCQPCRQQMPHFEHVQREYGDEIEVIAINIGINDDMDSIRKTIREFGLTMPLAVDKNGDLAQAFRLIGTPYHLVFDKDMNLIHFGHKADSVLDSSLALVAQRKQAEIIDPTVLIEKEPDIPLNLDDGKLHALFFTATWCDWYWAESRPQDSQGCIKAQQAVNSLYRETQYISWLGVINRLWTKDSDLTEYINKFSVRHPTAIDKSNRLFHQYAINALPTLVLIKHGAVVARLSDFTDLGDIARRLEALK